MARFVVVLGALFALAALPFGLAACGDDDDSDRGSPAAEADPEADPEARNTEDLGAPDTIIRVALGEWTVEAEDSSVPAGVIEFAVSNEGEKVHEFVVVKDGEEIDEIEGLRPGIFESLKVRLEPGSYEIACLLVVAEDGKTADHYDLGMRAEFTVE